MRTLNIKSLNGFEVVVKIDCGRTMVEKSYDGCQLDKKLSEWEEIDAVSTRDGVEIKHYLRDFHLRENDAFEVTIPAQVKETMNKYNAYGSVSGHGYVNGKSVYITLVLDEATYKGLKKAVEEDLVENTTIEAQEEINKVNNKKREDEVEEARSVLEDANNTITNKDGSLMSNKEALEWVKSYNNVNNEGGEGIVPRIITKETVEQAKEVINSARA